jgi:hypothetical protein
MRRSRAVKSLSKAKYIKQACVAAAVYIFIEEVLGSNLGRNTGCRDGFSWFLLLLPA